MRLIFLTSPPLSVYGEGGDATPYMYGSPSPFTERGLGGEVGEASEIAGAFPQVEAKPCTLIREGLGVRAKNSGRASSEGFVSLDTSIGIISSEVSSSAPRRWDADATRSASVASASRRRGALLELSIGITISIVSTLKPLHRKAVPPLPRRGRGGKGVRANLPLTSCGGAAPPSPPSLRPAQASRRVRAHKS